MPSTSLVRGEPPAERRRGGSSGGFSRFIVSVGIGVGATLAWQSYGDVARKMLAGSYPQLSWLAPRAAEAQTATATAVPVRTADQRLQEVTLALSALRQRMDQLSLQVAASQNQVTREITAKVQSAEHDILGKIAAAPTRRSTARESSLR